MNSVARKNIILIAVILIISTCTSCTNSIGGSMPEKETVAEFITNNTDDIQIISNYLLDSGYEYANIESSTGQIFVDAGHKYIDIDDSKVNTSISNLWKSGCRSITKSTQYNSVKFLLWRDNYKEIDCGFVCPIYDSREPQVNYQTELSHISDNWYYFVSDYEEWRSSN